jgi:hypothetical protein
MQQIAPKRIELSPFSFILCSFLTALLLMSQSRACAQSAYSYGADYSPNPNRIQRPLSMDTGNAGNVGNATGAVEVQQWFDQYDAVRRQAQMTPEERRKADAMMSQGMNFMLGGPEKAASQQLLSKLVNRYQLACQQLIRLPRIPATEELHRGYYQYFFDAGHLFADYIKVQENLFAVDDSTGKPVAGQLMSRKQMLEALDERNKSLDSQLRQQYGISPYRYQL